jgi:hypothetical protein
MDIDVFPPHELGTVFRVLRTALAPDAPLDPSHRRFLATFARITGHVPADPTLPTIGPHEVHIADAHPRKRLVQLAAVAALLNQPPKPAAAAYVAALAQRLAVHDGVVDVLAALVQGRRLRVRLLAMRRVMGAMLKEAYTGGGVRGLLRFFISMFMRSASDPARLLDYKRLGLLPDGTLGRTYWKHMTELGFGFPGESKGIPEAVAYHDVAHVLAEHATNPDGEIQQASFQAGARRDDGFFFLQFAILQFHQGVRLTPVAEPETGYFDPDKVLWALHRGAQCHVDFTHQWDFWPLLALPLDEARRRCGLLPKGTWA